MSFRNIIRQIINLLILILVLYVLFWGYTIPMNNIEDDIEKWLSTPYPSVQTTFEIVDKYQRNNVIFYTGALNNSEIKSNFIVCYKKNLILPLYRRKSSQLEDHKISYELNFCSINTFFYNYYAKSNNSNNELFVTEKKTYRNLLRLIVVIGASFLARIIRKVESVYNL